MKKKIDEGYDKTIDFDKITNENKNDIQIIWKQLKRLKYSVRNLKFKIIISEGKFFCFISRNNDIECCIKKKYDGPNYPKKKFYLSTDLETLYEQGKFMFKKQKKIFEAIYKILNDTYVINFRNLNNLLSQSGDINHFSSLITSTLNNLNQNINKLNKFLEIMNKADNKIREQINSIDETTSSTYQFGNINSEIFNQNKKDKLIVEKKEIGNIRVDIIKNLFKFNKQKMNVALSIDSIYYENQLYLLEISKNFSKLKNLL